MTRCGIERFSSAHGRLGSAFRAASPDFENLERIIQEHLIGGRPVQDLAFARGPLAGG